MNSLTYFPPLRRSVLLIGAAIFATTTAQAEIQIGRLPSIHAGDGQVVGAKPNLFLLIDNNAAMASKSSDAHAHTPDFNLLQQTSAALIASLPQLEGKVRLGYTTGYRGKEPIAGASCATYKLNGNVKRLFDAGHLSPEIKADLENNKKYVVGNNDFVFMSEEGEQTGSGFGEIIPRDFSGNYASYIYAWLGGMCPSSGGDKNTGSIVYPRPATAPPYAELDANKADEYRQAAKTAGNPASYPTTNVISNFGTQRSRPLVHMHGEVLKQIGDVNFFEQIAQCTNNRCGGKGGLPFLTFEDMKRDPRRRTHTANQREYDAYASADPSDGFPGIKPLSCRRNYEIIINAGTYAPPQNLSSNGKIGYSGVTKTSYDYTWDLPAVKSGTKGISETTFPYQEFYTRMYRYLSPFGLRSKGIEGLPTDSNFPNVNYLFGKSVFQSYYSDLRADLENDIKAFYAVENRPHGPNGTIIPKDWDRKNDTAPWQHLTVFSLGLDKFESWKLATVYNQNYDDLDPDGGPLEGYFRAIEDGSIEALNSPLADWGRGNNAKKDSYIFRDRSGTQSTIKMPPYRFGESDPLGEMDLAKAGVIGRGGSYMISDYNSIKKVISTIANRIETAMAQGISGGAIGGGGRVTASQQAAGGNDSILFTTYLDQENLSGNIFAFKNCPLIQEMIRDESGTLIPNPKWKDNNCGQRLWNAATALYSDPSSIEGKTIVPIENNNTRSGSTFAWDNLDQKLKDEFMRGGDEELGKARVEWINGKLASQFKPAIASKLRQRTTVYIPKEKQNYKRDSNGNLVEECDNDEKKCHFVLADPTDIPNLMGEIVYALPKAVDNRGTLPAVHPLNSQSYSDFVNNTVKERKALVLAGSNDGRLYGFSTADLSEYASLAFSFIPREVILKKNNNIVDFTKPEAIGVAGFADGLVNGPLTVRDAQVNGKWGTYVVGSLGEGGDAIYALDISDGRASESMFKWEVSGRGYGNVMAEPRIVWLRKPTSAGSKPDGKWVVLIPTGYNADSVSLVVLDLADGTELAKINTTAKYTVDKDNKTICQLDKLDSTEANNENANKLWNTLSAIGDISIPESLTCDNGLGPLTVFDADSDSGADFVFAGDLMGHVWKFDLTGFFDSSGNQTTDLNKALKVAYDSPLFIAQTPVKSNEQSTRQPITSMITIDDGAYGEGSMLYFGTGRMFNQRERGLKQQESFYGIWDIPRYSNQANITGFSLPLRRNPVLASGAKYDFLRYETFVVPNSQVADQESSLKSFDEIRGLKRTDNVDSTDYLSFNLEGQNTSDGEAVGWIIDFSSEDALERVINRSSSFEEVIFFPTFSPKGGSEEENCSPIQSGVDGDARFYMVNRLTGGQLAKSPFDFNHDGTQDDSSGKDGIKVRPDQLGKGGNLKGLGYAGNGDNNDKEPDENGEISVSPAGILIGSGGGDFLSVIGVLDRVSQAIATKPGGGGGGGDPDDKPKPKPKRDCDYTRQIVFPSTTDPVTGNPLVLSSCNSNRYRVWKQPIIE